MPRIRTVKPEYPKHRKARSVSRDARLLNIHLWNLADDAGRLQELPQWILGEVFPTDEDVTPGILTEWLGSLQEAGLIERYEVDGERYIQCHDWHDHQKISHPSESRIPAPDAGSVVSVKPPGNLPEASPREQGTGNKGTGSESARAKAEKKTPKRTKAKADHDSLPSDLPERLAPTVDQVIIVLARIVASRGGGGVAPTRLGVGRAIASYPDRDHGAAAESLEHWLVAGTGQNQRVRDVVGYYRNQLDRSPPVAPPPETSQLGRRARDRMEDATRLGGAA